MKKKRFAVNYSRMDTGLTTHIVGTFSLRVQAEKTLQILANNPWFLAGTIIETYVESI